jgi:hypothetical protein
MRTIEGSSKILEPGKKMHSMAETISKPSISHTFPIRLFQAKIQLEIQIKTNSVSKKAMTKK